MTRLFTIAALAVLVTACAQNMGSDVALPACVSHCTSVVIIEGTTMKRGENSPPVTTDLKLPVPGL